MKAFMDNDFLLQTETARDLYHNHAAQQPIIDYHCHLDPKMVAENHRFRSITELWLGGDHYKWRAMRTNGVPESLITGAESSDWEKFQAWDSDLIKGSLTGRYDADSAATRLISIILPSKDNPEVLRRCVKSVEKHTRIPFELIIVDNGSNHANRQKVQELVDEINENNSAIYVYREMEFNMSAFYNLGASYANGGLLLFLHDDVVVQRHEWLSHLSEKAKLPYVGAVGMKLLYPSSNIIQHAGIMSVQGTPVYKLQYRRNAETQYFGFNKGIRNVLAVTGACMMVRKELFDKVGGFDEERYPHCYSDIDFCYRIHEQGFYNVVRNNMYLFYHEASAPVEEVRRQRELQRDSELEILRAAHHPFYHKYLTQNIKEARFILDAGSLTI